MFLFFFLILTYICKINVTNITFGNNGAFIYSDNDTFGTTNMSILSCNFTNLTSNNGNGSAGRIKGVINIIYINNSYFNSLSASLGGCFYISYCKNVWF